MARVYATRTDLVNYVPATITVPAEPEATRLLTRASERIDHLLMSIGAVYTVDSVTKLPTDANLIEAFKLATCAQAQWWLETGDESGAGSLYSNVSIGRVSLGRAQAGGVPVTQRYAEQAVDHLRLAVDTNGVGLWLGMVGH